MVMIEQKVRELVGTMKDPYADNKDKPDLSFPPLWVIVDGEGDIIHPPSVVNQLFDIIPDTTMKSRLLYKFGLDFDISGNVIMAEAYRTNMIDDKAEKSEILMCMGQDATHHVVAFAEIHRGDNPHLGEWEFNVLERKSSTDDVILGGNMANLFPDEDALKERGARMALKGNPPIDLTEPVEVKEITHIDIPAIDC